MPRTLSRKTKENLETTIVSARFLGREPLVKSECVSIVIPQHKELLKSSERATWTRTKDACSSTR